MKRSMTWYLCAVVVGAGAYASTLRATPMSGFSGTTLAKATFDEINLNVRTLPAFWQAKLKTKGLSDLFVQSNVWKPGGTTGWHTHPGPSLIVVTGGTITAYDGDDPSCAPKPYTQGMGFVDPGGDHTHVLRNEDATFDATTVAVQLIPSAANRRIDAAAPANCPSSVK